MQCSTLIVAGICLFVCLPIHHAVHAAPGLAAVCNYIIENTVARMIWRFSGRKHVFAYFLFNVCLWIILDGALNIFSQYLRKQYRKIILQFDVLKLRTRKRTDNESQNNTNGDWIIPNVKGAFEILHSYQKFKHIYIFAHWNLSRGISARKKSGLLLQCLQHSFISERSGVSEQWRLPLSLRLSGNRFWTRPVAQYSWLMTSYCQHGD